MEIFKRFNRLQLSYFDMGCKNFVHCSNSCWKSTNSYACRIICIPFIPYFLFESVNDLTNRA